MAAALLLSVLFLAMTGHSSATWCVCKDGVGEANLQKALDYACGNGADCNPIHSNGPCFNPSTVKAHCSYAVNSYFQRKGQAQGSCDFAGTAAVSSTDPSSAGCSYPSSASASTGTSTTPTTPVTTTNPSTTAPTNMNPGTNTQTGTTPYGSTTPTGVLGGVGTGLGPSGTSTTNTDYSHGGLRLQAISSLTTFVFSGLMLLWG
ncbi:PLASMODESMATA CALLOSE-BINDING PROTEIN 3-like isoform X2 [Hibiscus syriacus]|uniref:PLASMODESMATA CALLOSE-BINDING PROTEIN 3-like isoform X2 n=1 Tax=Hibiscus syriacus TaxID=106335 RepID=UPI001922B720|nr:PLASMODESMATA CALLOSE-BINDING PROTEIN 3-like isoform X2 [Hibiscus syriacus]